MLVNKLLLISFLCWGSASCRLWYPEDLQYLMQIIFPKFSPDLPNVDFGDFIITSTPNVESEAPVTETEEPVTETEASMTETEASETETGAPVTETAGPVTEPEDEDHQCPSDESSFSKNDISVLVEYMANKMNIYQTINNSCYSQALSIREKHENNIKEFKRRLEERPHHLKHILEDMTAMRKQLEPIITTINDSLQEYSSYEISLTKTLEHAQDVLKHLNNTKQICILMKCGEHHLKIRGEHNEYPYVASGVSQDPKYCSTLTRITEKIAASLTKFQNEFTKNITISLIHEDKYYTQNILDLKKNLKELAVKKFGMTMYNILNIQDDYYHLSEELNNNKVVSELEEIKTNRLQIDYLVVKMESALKKFDKYCISCNQPLLFYHRLSADDNSANDSQMAKDLVDEYIQAKLFEIESNIYGDYTNIFKELNELLNVKDLENTYLANLKPIQDEITKDIVEERERLDKLKNSVPSETIDKLSELFMKSNDMLQTVQKELNQIASFLN